MVSTRVNFYDTGQTGIDDDAFEQSFTDIYRVNSLQKPWYLGKGVFRSKNFWLLATVALSLLFGKNCPIMD